MRVLKKVPELFPRAAFYEPARRTADVSSRRTLRNQFWVGGPEGQKRIRELKVAVAGLGGMGSHIAELLVRLGVGHLRIADPDTIEVTNLNRQVIARRETIGKSKALVAAEELRGIADDFELVVYTDGVTEANAAEFVEGCDLVVDEIDVYPLEAHVLLHRAARARNLPLYSAYAVGMGTHFYKFHGEEYTFEDFLGPDRALWKKPTAQFIMDLFGPPLPSYLDPAQVEGFRREIEGGCTPIFGPTTLLGHSLVVFRIVIDQLGGKLGKAGLLFGGAEIPETPVMPEFLALDLADLKVTKAQVPRGSKKPRNE